MRWRPFDRSRDRTNPIGEADAVARRRMVAEQIEARGLDDPELLRALLTVPRHRFVDEAESEAYADRALGIGSGQTISQPYVVAVMTDSARPPQGWRGTKALEIGTGSGYQAAVLAELGASVTSIERHARLADTARRRLAEAGYADSVDVRVGDGTEGAPDAAPFDAIIVTAAGPDIPDPLIAQLGDGGRLVIPVGSLDSQVLTVVRRRGDRVEMRQTERVVFVPLIGEHGFKHD